MEEIYNFRGAPEVLRILLKFTEPVLEKTFIKEFKRELYYQAFTRSKATLIEKGLINITVEGRTGEKLIALTIKGRQIAELLKKAEEILS